MSRTDAGPYSVPERDPNPPPMRGASARRYFVRGIHVLDMDTSSLIAIAEDTTYAEMIADSLNATVAS